MNKNIIKLASVLSLPLLTFAANASDGTITFNGQITASTCTVDVDGQGGDATITLPTVSKDILSSAGDTAGRTAFNITLTDCTLSTSPAETKFTTYFEAGSTVDLATGRLKNSGTATNVSLRLYDEGTNNEIQIGNASQTTNNSEATFTGSAGSATASLPYSVEYYADGASTAGTVVSSVEYSIHYK